MHRFRVMTMFYLSTHLFTPFTPLTALPTVYLTLNEQDLGSPGSYLQLSNLTLYRKNAPFSSYDNVLPFYTPFYTL